MFAGKVEKLKQEFFRRPSPQTNTEEYMSMWEELLTTTIDPHSPLAPVIPYCGTPLKVGLEKLYEFNQNIDIQVGSPMISGLDEQTIFNDHIVVGMGDGRGHYAYFINVNHRNISKVLGGSFCIVSYVMDITRVLVLPILLKRAASYAELKTLTAERRKEVLDMEFVFWLKENGLLLEDKTNSVVGNSLGTLGITTINLDFLKG